MVGGTADKGSQPGGGVEAVAYHRSPMAEPQAPARRDDDDERRPTALLLVYTWDIVLAIFAAVGALTVFSGSREVRGQTVAIPIAVQLFQALAYAALGTALFLIGTLLTRRQRWVRRAQVVVLAMHVALIAVSLALTLVTDESSRNAGVVLVSSVFALVDVLALFALTGERVGRWFDEPGEVPLYIGGLVAFWAATSAAFFVLGLVTE